MMPVFKRKSLFLGVGTYDHPEPLQYEWGRVNVQQLGWLYCVRPPYRRLHPPSVLGSPRATQECCGAPPDPAVDRFPVVELHRSLSLAAVPVSPGHSHPHPGWINMFVWLLLISSVTPPKEQGGTNSLFQDPRNPNPHQNPSLPWRVPVGLHRLMDA